MSELDERWKIDGDCTLCRKAKYCSKPCTAAKKHHDAIVRGMVGNAMDEATHGAYSGMLKAYESIIRKGLQQ